MQSILPGGKYCCFILFLYLTQESDNCQGLTDKGKEKCQEKKNDRKMDQRIRGLRKQVFFPEEESGQQPVTKTSKNGSKSIGDDVIDISGTI